MPKSPLPLAKRKPRNTGKPYGPHPLKIKSTDANAKPQKPARANLALLEWVTVVAYYDANPGITQSEVVQYFKTRKGNPLFFNQATLSRHLSPAGQKADRAKVDSTPTALTAKRARIVTRPDVEMALVVWIKHMQEKKEVFSGPMLIAKRQQFEEQLNVPENERLKSHGWVHNFTKTYGVHEIRRHGEAASVDAAAASAERTRVQKINRLFAADNIFNFDETGVFLFAPPDRGLALKKMSGRKSSKARITIGFATNASGSEKLPPFYIGKFKNPRCFGKKGPAGDGFYYRNNKTAWMTAILFEEWIRLRDLEFRRQNRHVLLWIDNFSGHNILYKPTHIRIEFFEPNLTSHVQPLDAGIIRCFKAHYRRLFCLRAIKLDDAGLEDIYKIDLREAMLMTRTAWASVSAKTIAACWRHAGVLPAATSASVSGQNALQNKAAWDIVLAWASGTISSLPLVEQQLQELLGVSYKPSEWKHAFDVIFEAEDDEVAAVEGIRGLAKAALNTDSQAAPVEPVATLYCNRCHHCVPKVMQHEPPI